METNTTAFFDKAEDIETTFLLRSGTRRRFESVVIDARCGELFREGSQ